MLLAVGDPGGGGGGGGGGGAPIGGGGGPGTMTGGPLYSTRSCFFVASIGRVTGGGGAERDGRSADGGARSKPTARHAAGLGVPSSIGGGAAVAPTGAGATVMTAATAARIMLGVRCFG
ncbi:hypothetical protein EJ082_13450 [Brevundimonas diminuta]|uniref:Uncharacterized protein n=1 Tax=Brevundimonas diminuta TaxID=293 RepID=A0A410NWH8_BREDI|nr:hypothetical protein [Brevundimonas diminuta]QAT14240.1 hypothetical protein EQG53_07600 [Brevundimonas diminuta]